MTPPVAGAQALVVAAVILLGGYVVASRLSNDIDRITAWGLALAGSAGIALVLMAVHMVSGGAVFSSVALTCTLAATAVAISLATGRVRGTSRFKPLGSHAEPVAAVAMVALAVAIWCAPAFWSNPLPSPWRVDIMRHVGMTSALLQGASVSSAPVAADSVPNDYPWLYHATLALTTRLTPPGTPALRGLAALQVLCVAGGALGLFALGRELRQRWTAGAFTVLFGALTGGFGFVLLERVDAIVYPRKRLLDYMGDLLFVRSYNGAMNYVTGPYPRDLALALLPSFLLLVVRALRKPSRARFAASGVVLGILGLCGAEAFFVATLTVILLLLFCRVPDARFNRGRAIGIVLVAAGAVYALWAVPLLISYLRYESRSLAVGLVALPPVGILMSWGVVAPLGLIGAWRLRPLDRSDVTRLVPFTVCASTAILLVVSVGLPRFGGVFATLGFAHRYWPLLFVGAALYAALLASTLVDGALQPGRSAGLRLGCVAMVLAVAGAAVTSPTIASLAAPRLMDDAVFENALSGDPKNLLNVLAPDPGEECVVVAPQTATARILAYTGSRFVVYPMVGRGRFKTLSRRELRRRRRDNRTLLEVRGTEDSWRKIARTYGVDMVVIFMHLADLPAVRGFPQTGGTLGRRKLVVVHVTACGNERGASSVGGHTQTTRGDDPPA